MYESYFESETLTGNLQSKGHIGVKKSSYVY